MVTDQFCFRLVYKQKATLKQVFTVQSYDERRLMWTGLERFNYTYFKDEFGQLRSNRDLGSWFKAKSFSCLSNLEKSLRPFR